MVRLNFNDFTAGMFLTCLYAAGFSTQVGQVHVGLPAIDYGVGILAGSLCCSSVCHCHLMTEPQNHCLMWQTQLVTHQFFKLNKTVEMQWKKKNCWSYQKIPPTGFPLFGFCFCEEEGETTNKAQCEALKTAHSSDSQPLECHSAMGRPAEIWIWEEQQGAYPIRDKILRRLY